MGAVCGGAAPNHHGDFHRIEVELLVVSYCVAACPVLQAYPPVKMQGCVDEIAVCVEGKNSELPNIALTVLKKAKVEVEKVCLQDVKKPIDATFQTITPNSFFAVVIVLGED